MFVFYLILKYVSNFFLNFTHVSKQNEISLGNRAFIVQ